MSDDIKLKACPFCGKQPSEEFCQRRYDFDFAIECECGACMSQCMWEGGPGKGTRAETMAQWNARATSDLTKRLAEALRSYFTSNETDPERIAKENHSVRAILSEYDASIATGEDAK